MCVCVSVCLSVSVCVLHSCHQWYTHFLIELERSELQGAPGDCRRLAPTKTFLLSCDIDLGRQVDIPALYKTSMQLGAWG